MTRTSPAASVTASGTSPPNAASTRRGSGGTWSSSGCSRASVSENWVLKGGFCLEVRLGTAARTTKDLDLALVTDEQVGSVLDVQDLLFAEVSATTPADGFRFDVGLPAPISADELGNPGWRITIRSTVGGDHFESVKVDVVARPGEIAGGVETLVLKPLLPGVAGHDPVAVHAVDVHQHAAEKLHAYARVYARDRPSSRVKDFVDLVLLTEAGVLSREPLSTRLRQVYAVRDASTPPPDLPPPPASWTAPYATMAAELGLTASTAEQGWATVAAEYRLALPPPTERPSHEPDAHQIHRTADDPDPVVCSDQRVAQHHAEGRRAERRAGPAPPDGVVAVPQSLRRS